MTKRLVVMLTVMAMLLSLAACNPPNKGGDKETEVANESTGEKKSDTEVSDSSTVSTEENSKLFDKPVKLSILMGSHPSWPYKDDYKIWQYVREATGAELEVTAVPLNEYPTKVNLIISSRQIPDLMWFTAKSTADQYGPEGVFMPIMQNLDKLPNFKKWINSTEDSDEYIRQRTSGDGNVYYFPTYGLHTVNNALAWLYRKDVFEKNNLKPPENTDELYAVAKKLKELYPESYPVCFRSWLHRLGIIASQWATDMQVKVYYDFEAKEWKYGAVQDEFKEMIIFYKKLYDEGLMPPDFLTINTKTWQQLVSDNKGFMFPDYIVRIDFFNGPARVTDPDFTLAVMKPPKGGKNGSDYLPKSNLETSGYAVCNTGDKENIDNAFKFVDWFYSKEGKELVSWGKEGETYKVVNGKKQFILDDKNTPPRNLYGAGTYGLYQYIDVEANESLYSEENIKEARKMLTFFRRNANPTFWLAYNEEEQELKNQLSPVINTYMNQELSKFISGKRPLSEWDQYVKEIKDLGLDRFLEIYDAAYKRVTK